MTASTHSDTSNNSYFQLVIDMSDLSDSDRDFLLRGMYSFSAMLDCTDILSLDIAPAAPVPSSVTSIIQDESPASS